MIIMTGTKIFLKALRNLVPGFALLILLPVPVQAQGDLPDIPKIIVMTWVHESNDVLIQWEASKDPEVDRYQMYKPIGTGWEKIYVFEAETFEYTITSDLHKGQTITVTALDTLDGGPEDRESLLGENAHRAVEISLEYDACTPGNTINWTGYVGWEGNTSGYRIYGGLKGENPELIQFVHPGIRTYTHRDIIYDRAYKYYVEAVHTSGVVSLSPVAEVLTSFPDVPDLLRVDEVSVLDKNSIELRFTADVGGPVNSFRILRRNSQESAYLEIETIWNSNQSVMDYTDQVPALDGPYEYMIESIYSPDGCNKVFPIDSSNVGTSILLEGKLDGQLAQLTWTPYEAYETGLSGYRIQRKSDTGEFIDISSVGAETTFWQESIDGITEGQQAGEIQYKIQALSNQVEGAEPGISESNEVSVFIETTIQVPDAFTPGQATNYLFKPLLDFAPKKYKMVIYDRSGRKLFETGDPSQGWDGSFNGGDFAMEGVYVYFIQYTDFKNISITRSGNVTVIYPSQY